MIRAIKTTALAILCCTAVAGAGIIGYDKATASEASSASDASTASSSDADSSATDVTTASWKNSTDTFTGTKKIRVQGHTVNVSCSGERTWGKPVVVLLPGAGDGLDAMADFQKALSEKNRVCVYDRLGEGESDKPDGLQTADDTGRLLTGVLNRITGDSPVVLAGHSLGGLIAARYAPGHTDRVKGLVLLDPTIPNLTADISRTIPADATGVAGDTRAKVLASNEGDNNEKYLIADAPVRSAGSIPVEIIKHESQYSSIPDYGPALEEMWSKGEHQWLGLSCHSRLSTAKGSDHYIYLDRPDLALSAVQRVTAQATAHHHQHR